MRFTLLCERNHQATRLCVPAFLVLTAFMSFSPFVFAAKDESIPDFTKGDAMPDKAPHDWNLGPTGARGWMYASKGETTDSRQIYITAVDAGSPSDGILEKGDVILGIRERPFSRDARITLAKAITEAEGNHGRVPILRWRKGKTEPVTIRIARLGSYASTAPYNCPKSQRILGAGCEAIAANLKNPEGKKRNPIERSLNALALLASGEDKYLPLVEKEAEWAANWEIDETQFYSWWAGWVGIFLAEYTLATGDRSYFKDLERLALDIALGQSNVGSWGHRFAYKHNGILRGYGAMNQVGLSLTTALILAREAGVEMDPVDNAIDRSQKFLRFYVGKGAIPYGDHHPWINMHDDNGKASAAALMFDLLGDRGAVEFFSLMATSSHGIERESGHTGNFFNMLWALPGVSRAGPHATGAWVKETAWLLDLARTWKGEFDFLGKPGFRRGAEHQYGGWDCTGAYLLSYALPKRKTLFTGSRKSTVPLITRDAAIQLAKDGRGWMPKSKGASYEQRSVAELIKNLGSWSPVIRERAALALAKKNEKTSDVMPEIVRMASSGKRNARLGACAALEHLGKRGADGVPVLIELLRSKDYWLQVQAAEALAGIGKPAQVATPDLLKLVATPPYPDDLRGYRQRYVAFALFDQTTGLLSKSSEDMDHAQLVEGVIAVLKNEDGRARGSVASTFDRLHYRQLKPLLPAIHRAIVEQAPSGVMFGDNIRMAGLDLLAKHHIAEGMHLCVQLVEPERWGRSNRLKRCMKALAAYGGAAGSVMPALARLEKELEELNANADQLDLVRNTVADIKKSSSFPKLITLSGDAWRGTVPSQGQTPDAVVQARPLKVFILAGQSNMEGAAKVETFDYIGDDPATAPLLKEMLGPDGAPRVCDKVWISYLTGWKELGEGIGKLTAGFGSRSNPTENGGKIGPEFTFGITMEQAYDGPVLVIKTAWGGKSLHTDFRSPSAGPYELSSFQLDSYPQQQGHGIPKDFEQWKVDKAEATGTYYRLMMEHITNVLGDIRRVYPDYDPEQGYELAGFVWFQGWNDMVDRHTYSKWHEPGGYDLYSELLAHFIRDVRRELSAPKMPFVIGVMGVGGPIDQHYHPGSKKEHGYFRAAMAAPAAMAEFKGNVVAVETAPYWDASLAAIELKHGTIRQMEHFLRTEHKEHANKDGTMTKEEQQDYIKRYRSELISPEEEALWERGASNAGYHYLGSAKTMALIGQAFAEALLEFDGRTLPLDRVWTDLKGRKLRATLQGREGSKVVLLSGKGKLYKMEKADLCQADQQVLDGDNR